MKSIRVLLVDDHQVVREGLKRMLDLDKDIEVVGEATSGEEALTKAEQLSPEVFHQHDVAADMIHLAEKKPAPVGRD